MYHFFKLKKGNLYLKHPLDDCVLRIKMDNKGREMFARFSKEQEYKPKDQSCNLILDALLSTHKVWITKEEYYDF